MLRFFENLKAPAPSYTLGHRQAEKINMGLNLTESIAKTAINSPVVEIGIAFPQTLVSGYAILRKDIKIDEKMIHLLQGLLASGKLTLALILFLSNELCENSSSWGALCRTFNVLQILYNSILLLAWTGGELFKEEVQVCNNFSNKIYNCNDRINNVNLDNISSVSNASQQALSLEQHGIFYSNDIQDNNFVDNVSDSLPHLSNN